MRKTDNILSDYDAACPYCGEHFSTMLDLSQDQNNGSHEYIEDCQICCRPILFSIGQDPVTDEFNVQLRRDDD
ncbi:hypothetical protein MNBD_GAMMA21-2397 [hydrothermal vent metagenome]|uniref:Restriction endonuclease n=1 Tax=hydrothermal vent metagenome TaxID=652676 RepID=A0A3B1A2A3_9ZZZZ